MPDFEKEINKLQKQLIEKYEGRYPLNQAPEQPEFRKTRHEFDQLKHKAEEELLQALVDLVLAGPPDPPFEQVTFEDIEQEYKSRLKKSDDDST